jgi:hypothetical protein
VPVSRLTMNKNESSGLMLDHISISEWMVNHLNAVRHTDSMLRSIEISWSAIQGLNSCFESSDEN